MSWLENGKEDNTDLKEKYERKGMIYIIIGLVVIAKIAAIIGGFLWVMYMIGLLVLCYIVNH
jgi:flagellar basal body-associated protein FliL